LKSGFVFFKKKKLEGKGRPIFKCVSEAFKSRF